MKALEHCSTKEKKIETLLKYQEDIILTAFGAGYTWASAAIKW